MKNHFFKFFLFFFIIGISCNSINSANKKNSLIQLKKEALEFSLEVVKNIFENDCPSLQSKFETEIMALDGDGIFKISDVKNKLCNALDGAISDDRKKYGDYLNDYKTEILTVETYLAKSKLELPSYYSPAQFDFFFLGAELKNEEIRNYIFDDLFFFLIRKDGNSWKIIGVI